MIRLDPKYRPLLLEAVEELMYKVSVQLEKFKGAPLTQERKQLIQKQKQLEEVQHVIFFKEEKSV